MGLEAVLKECYDGYDQEVRKAVSQAKPADGLFGFGTAVSDLPMHEAFYHRVESIISEAADSTLQPGEAACAVRFLLEAHRSYPLKETVWTCVACEKHAVPLISFLTPGEAAELLQFYDRISPRRRRLPVQKEVAKALKSAC